MLKAFYTALLLCSWGPAGHAQNSLIDRAQQMKESMVEVKTIYTRPLHTKDGDRMASFERKGVGIILDKTGIIATNTHTIVNAPRILVTLSNGSQSEAQAIFVAQGRDFSFIKIDPSPALKPIQWADSSQTKIGDEILTIGSSDYDSASILSGKITALVQNNTTGQIEMLETNLNLYKGDSGGPIINRNGALLGMIMAKNKRQDRLSLAIASDIIHLEYLKWRKNR